MKWKYLSKIVLTSFIFQLIRHEHGAHNNFTIHRAGPWDMTGGYPKAIKIDSLTISWAREKAMLAQKIYSTAARIQFRFCAQRTNDHLLCAA